MIGVGVLGLACGLGYGIGGPGDDPVNQYGAGGVISAIALLFLARGLTGEWGQRQLRVDIAAGKLMLPDGSLHELDELGELILDSKPLPRRRMTDTQIHEYRLHAKNCKYYLYDSVYESETLLRREALEEAILESHLRKILERPTGDGSAFRDGPDALTEIRALAIDPSRVVAALNTLTKDPDSHVRSQAQKLATQL